MSAHKSTKVIFDTNIWVSFLIGKRLHSLKDLLGERQILIIFSEQLLLELRTVTQRAKLKNYFNEDKVGELISFIRTVGLIYQARSKNQLSRDPKDNFLLDLAEASKADFLITGDKDLLVLHPFGKTQIITAADFEKEIGKLNPSS